MEVPPEEKSTPCDGEVAFPCHSVLCVFSFLLPTLVSSSQRSLLSLSPQEVEKLESLLATLVGSVDETWRGLPEEYRGPLLRRYLREKKGDVPAAAIGLHDHLNWRGKWLHSDPLFE